MGNAVEEGKPSKAQGTFDFGVVAVDKELNSRKLKVYPRAKLPQVEGELKAVEISNNVKTEGDTSAGYSGEVKTKNFYEAEYIDLMSNRFWPPDMRAGEQVFLINFYDSDQWYWYPMGRDDNYRKCERLRFAISDDIKPQKELNDDNTWFIEMDTLTKKCITIQTSKSDTEDPEKFRYKIEIDAKASRVRIMDDDNNEICLDSENTRIYLRNKDQSIVDINKRNVIIDAPDDIVLNAGRQIVRNAPVETNLNDQGSATTVMKAKNMSIVCSDSLTINSPSIGFTGAVAIAETLVSGPIQAEGYSTGGTTQYGDATTDISNGNGGGGNTPSTGDGGSNNRHCSAWEEVNAALNLIAGDLDRIDGIIGHRTSGEEVRRNADDSKMTINKGK